jgi:oligo-1,6-glucosidase
MVNKTTIIKKNDWWKEAVFYQIWPRSFNDGNGDGIGDLKGIYDKLQYIKDLGADAIWFSPLYVSPQKDYGYDIADYYNIAPEYGTMEEFKKVLDKAHQLGIKVIMDLVINHTSNQHKWFLESRKGGDDNPYKDYYIWRKGKGKDQKRFPNNWNSTFPGDGWEYDEVRKEFYLHLFAVEQPDLNMDNPKVREEIKKIMRFYLEMGVDGFREDVITFISKKEGLPNGFPLPTARGLEHYVNGPNIHKYLAEFKEVLDEYGAVTVGEAPLVTTKSALTYVTEKDKQLDMMFHFQHMDADSFLVSWFRLPFNLVKLKKVLNKWQTRLYNKAWNALFLENHDQPRVISRYGSEKFREESGKALACMYLCQSGTPFIYQGQEIGMTNYPFEKMEDFVDVNTFAFYKILKKFGFKHETILKKAKYAARDNARTPMQWDNSKNAGFTTAEKPWFNVNPNYTNINVADSQNNENSLLNFYKELLLLRKDNKAMIFGSFHLYYKRDKKLFVYEKRHEDERVFVVINVSEEHTKLKIPSEIKLDNYNLLLSNYQENEQTLKPYECRIYSNRR